MRVRSMLLVACCVVLAPASGGRAALQSPASSEPARFDPQAVVVEMRRIIAKDYVLPERRAALDAVLAEGLASGRYRVDNPGELLDRVNADLKRVGRDRHLYLDYDPKRAAILAAPGKASPADPKAFERQARARNFGVAELRVLPGNVRYMGYEGDRGIWLEKQSRAAMDNAMRFLSGGDAIIIDIRKNGGGTPLPSQYLLSHFLPAGKHLYTFYEGSHVKRAHTLGTVPLGRMIGKPLYVLTSDATASAAEELAGNVAGFGIGKVVGGTTAGAGYMNELVPIAGQFVFSVSIARVVLASTGRDWEAAGIEPTVKVDPGNALDVAYLDALRQLAATASSDDRAPLVALADGIAARTAPQASALALSAYIGQFGERRIFAEGARLFYQRGDRPKILLLPLGGNRFAFDSNPADHVEFAVTGNRVESFSILLSDGTPQGPYRRTVQ